MEFKQKARNSKLRLITKSHYLNPIKNLWWNVKLTLRHRGSHNVCEQEDNVNARWVNITRERSATLEKIMQRYRPWWSYIKTILSRTMSIDAGISQLNFSWYKNIIRKKMFADMSKTIITRTEWTNILVLFVFILWLYINFI